MAPNDGKPTAARGRGGRAFEHPLVAAAAERYRRADVGPEGYPLPKGTGVFRLRVSKRSLRRALQILDCALTAAAKAGHEVRLSEDPVPDVVVEVGGVPLAFTVREAQEVRHDGPAVPRERDSWHDLIARHRRTTTRVFSGRLSLVCLETSCEGERRQWRDGARVRFESLVEGFLRTLPRLAQAKRKQEREGARRRRDPEESYHQRWAPEEEARQDAFWRTRRLIAALDGWRQSRDLRRFLAEFRRRLEERGTPILPGGELDRWFTWASAYAERNDPTLRPVDPHEFPIADAPDGFDWLDGPKF